MCPNVTRMTGNETEMIGTTWNNTAFDRITECQEKPVLLQLVRHNPVYQFHSCPVWSNTLLFCFIPLHAGKLFIHIGLTFFVAKLPCGYLYDSLQIWNSKRYFYGKCFYRFRFFIFLYFLAGK